MSYLCSVLRKKTQEKNVLQITKLFIQIRNISIRNQILNKKNFYDSLEITPKATQNEIKSAYYKLSMLYHPDKNKDSEDAAGKFRDISEAYEVLGNFKLRKLYDKGIIHTADFKYAHAQEPPEDDPQTKFYKQHMRKSAAPPVSGRTPIYDFDEWSRNHYGAAFERRQSAKLRFNEKKGKLSEDKLNRQTIYLIFSLSLLITMFTIVIYSESQYDEPKQPLSDTKR